MHKLPSIGSTWRHYEGGLYIVCGYVVDKDSGKTKIAYHNMENPYIYVRDPEVWFGLVKCADNPDKLVPRYSEIGNYEQFYTEI